MWLYFSSQFSHVLRFLFAYPWHRNPGFLQESILAKASTGMTEPDNWYLITHNFQLYVCFSYHYVPSTLRRRAPEVFSSDFFWSEKSARRKVRQPYESRDTLPYRRCFQWARTHPWDDDRRRACHLSMSVWESRRERCSEYQLLWELWDDLRCPREARKSLHIEHYICEDEEL